MNLFQITHCGEAWEIVHLIFIFVFQMVNLLLAKGANINAFDKKDRRALHWAAYMGKNFRNERHSRDNHLQSATDLQITT